MLWVKGRGLAVPPRMAPAGCAFPYVTGAAVVEIGPNWTPAEFRCRRELERTAGRALVAQLAQATASLYAARL